MDLLIFICSVSDCISASNEEWEEINLSVISQTVYLVLLLDLKFCWDLRNKKNNEKIVLEIIELKEFLI